jgi:hypothetical protein
MMDRRLVLAVDRYRYQAIGWTGTDLDYYE